MQRSKYFRVFVFVLLMAAFVLPLAPASAQTNETQQNNKDAVRAALKLLETNDPEGYAQLFTEPFMMNQGDANLYETTQEDVAMFTGAVIGAIPDLQVEPTVMIAQGDWVAVEASYSGTFSQPFDFQYISPDPIPPTNQAVSWTEMDFMHFNDEGKIDTVWIASDPTVMMGQLGVMPPMGEDEGPSGTLLTTPAGYQLLSADELAATYTSGNTEQSLAQFNAVIDSLALDFGADTSAYYTDPYISWFNGIPTEVTAEEAMGNTQFFGAIQTAMPDVTPSADVVVAEGDWVAALITVRGTSTNELDLSNLGETGTLPPTGLSMEWQVGSIDRYNADGIVVEEWTETDASPMLIALGVMPPMDQNQ